jgi:hypothetical protein
MLWHAIKREHFTQQAIACGVNSVTNPFQQVVTIVHIKINGKVLPVPN